MTVLEAYPTLERVLRLSIEGTKRHRVLAVIAAYLDEGAEPSLREIAERAELDGWRKAEVLIRRLEADGLLRVEWAKPRRRTGERMARNRYELLLPESGGG